MHQFEPHKAYQTTLGSPSKNTIPPGLTCPRLILIVKQASVGSCRSFPFCNKAPHMNKFTFGDPSYLCNVHLTLSLESHYKESRIWKLTKNNCHPFNLGAAVCRTKYQNCKYTVNRSL